MLVVSIQIKDNDYLISDPKCNTLFTETGSKQHPTQRFDKRAPESRFTAAEILFLFFQRQSSGRLTVQAEVDIFELKTSSSSPPPCSGLCLLIHYNRFIYLAPSNITMNTILIFIKLTFI